MQRYLSEQTKLISTIATLFSAQAFQFYYLQVIQTLQQRYGEHTAYSEVDNQPNRSPEFAQSKKESKKQRIEPGLKLGITVALNISAFYTITLGMKQINNYQQDKTFKEVFFAITEMTIGFKSQNFKVEDFPLLMVA